MVEDSPAAASNRKVSGESGRRWMTTRAGAGVQYLPFTGPIVWGTRNDPGVDVIASDFQLVIDNLEVGHRAAAVWRSERQAEARSLTR